MHFAQSTGNNLQPQCPLEVSLNTNTNHRRRQPLRHRQEESENNSHVSSSFIAHRRSSSLSISFNRIVIVDDKPIFSERPLQQGLLSTRTFRSVVQISVIIAVPRFFFCQQSILSIPTDAATFIATPHHTM